MVSFQRASPVPSLRCLRSEDSMRGVKKPFAIDSGFGVLREHESASGVSSRENIGFTLLITGY